MPTVRKLMFTGISLAVTAPVLRRPPYYRIHLADIPHFDLFTGKVSTRRAGTAP